MWYIISIVALQPSLHQRDKTELEMRLKEHRDACERGMIERSAAAKHAWEIHHPIHWEETTVLDLGRRQELLVKETLHIQMTPAEEHFN